MDYRKYITIDPNKRGGKPCVRRLRITVYEVIECLAAEMAEEAILADFRDLTREDLKAVIAFAADRERRLITLPVAENWLGAYTIRPFFRITRRCRQYEGGVAKSYR